MEKHSETAHIASIPRTNSLQEDMDKRGDMLMVGGQSWNNYETTKSPKSTLLADNTRGSITTKQTKGDISCFLPISSLLPNFFAFAQFLHFTNFFISPVPSFFFFIFFLM